MSSPKSANISFTHPTNRSDIIVQNQRLSPKLYRPNYQKAPELVFDVAEESKSNASDNSMDNLQQAGATLYRNGGSRAKK